MIRTRIDPSPRGWTWVCTIVVCALQGACGHAAEDPGEGEHTAQRDDAVLDGMLGAYVVIEHASRAGCLEADPDGFFVSLSPCEPWRYTQQWLAEPKGGPDGAPYVSFVNGDRWEALEVRDWATHNGAIVGEYRYQSWQDNMTWQVHQVWDGVYQLQAKHSGRCLDLFGGAQWDGAAVGQWDCYFGSNQHWIIWRY